MDFVNEQTRSLKPYPMEKLNEIKRDLLTQNKKIYDFGTGDPKLATWEPIRQALKNALPEVSQYPSIKGTKELNEAFSGYYARRFGQEIDSGSICLPTRGSKEAIFHITLSLIGRNPKRTVLYPIPGYPVYKTAINFAQGNPLPYHLNIENNYLFEPWKLSQAQFEDCCAMWVNYPHNPTGRSVDREYWVQLINWCHSKDIILLSDDCYLDIYNSGNEPPLSPLVLSSDRVISFMSLSKRSGMTGYRSGFMVGDRRILEPHTRARANFGLGNPSFVQNASVVAWNDDQHVEERRRFFTEKRELAISLLADTDCLPFEPDSTFYLWCLLPKRWHGRDVEFSEQMAREGVILIPSTWLSDPDGNSVRFSLSLNNDDLIKGIELFKQKLKTI